MTLSYLLQSVTPMSAPTHTSPQSVSALLQPAVYGAIIAALTTALGYGLAELRHVRERQRQQREDLDKRIAEKVNAKFGELFEDIRKTDSLTRTQLASLEESRDALQTAHNSLQEQTRQMQGQLEATLAERKAQIEELLRRTMESSSQLETFQQRFGALASTAESSLPRRIVIALRDERDDAKRLALFTNLLNSDPDALTAEVAGDLARKDNNLALAEQLYALALSKDPDNARIQAEQQYTRGIRKSFTTDIRAKLESLVTSSDDVHVLNTLINMHIHLRDYDGLQRLCRKQLESCTTNKRPVLWRNLAVALDELGSKPDEVIQAYESAMEGGTAADMANAARPFVDYLIRQGKFEVAHRVVSRALKRIPLSTDLLIRLAEVLVVSGKVTEGEIVYGFAETTSHSDEERVDIRRRQAGLRVWSELELRGLVAPQLAPQPAVPSDGN